jgi:hypothetical protein
MPLRLLPCQGSRTSLRRWHRANKTSQDFVVFAANAIRSSDDANCRGRAGVTLGTRWSGGTGCASRALRPWAPAIDPVPCTGKSPRAYGNDAMPAGPRGLPDLSPMRVVFLNGTGEKRRGKPVAKAQSDPPANGGPGHGERTTSPSKKPSASEAW